jgi:NADH-quinone oxidoreductase subunit E
MQRVAQTRDQQPVEHISDQDKQVMDEWIAKFPPEQKASAVVPSLLLIQKNHGGWLRNSLLEEVADYLGMPRIAVYEVATFYSMLELKPVGKHKICVCTNISCMLRGSDKIVKHLEKRLGIPLGGTTPDGKFTLKEVECLASCVTAPMFQIGDEYHENLTPEKVDKILESLE